MSGGSDWFARQNAQHAQQFHRFHQQNQKRNDRAMADLMAKSRARRAWKQQQAKERQQWSSPTAESSAAHEEAPPLNGDGDLTFDGYRVAGIQSGPRYHHHHRRKMLVIIALVTSLLVVSTVFAYRKGWLPENATGWLSGGAVEATLLVDSRVRQGPSTSAPIVDILAAETKVSVACDQSGWARLASPHDGSYIGLRLLRVDGELPAC